MNAMEKPYEVFEKIKYGGMLVSGGVIYLMILFICLDILLRNLTGGSIPGSYEIVQNYVMPLVVLPAMPYVYSSGIMPRIDMLVGKFSLRWRNVFVQLVVVVEIILFFLFFYYTWRFALTGVEDQAGFPAGSYIFPVYPLYFLAPLAFGMICIECVFIFIRNLGRSACIMTVVEHEKELLVD